ncbi:hypothetical protein GCM10027028_30500 [Streptomyces sundarbansensis]
MIPPLSDQPLLDEPFYPGAHRPADAPDRRPDPRTRPERCRSLARLSHRPVRGRPGTGRGDRLLHRRPPGDPHRRDPPRSGSRPRRVPRPPSPPGPESLLRLTADVHFGHAATDISPEALGELNRSLDTAGIDHTSEIYPGTVHGFTMSDTDAFDPAALRHHWNRLLPLLGHALAKG